MRVRSKQGRFYGCALTKSQLEELWGVARHECGPAEAAGLIHRQDDVEVRTPSVEQLIKESGNPKKLDNLILTAEQDIPHRYVKVEVGPGNGTKVTVEADDHTWALGRYEEIVEILKKSRSYIARELATMVPVGYGVLGPVLLMASVGLWGLVDLITNILLPRTPKLYVFVTFLALYAAGLRWGWTGLRSYVDLRSQRKYDPIAVASLGVAALSLVATVIQTVKT